MTPYEALHGRRCRTPLSWTEVGERRLMRHELVDDTTEKIIFIKDILKATKDK